MENSLVSLPVPLLTHYCLLTKADCYASVMEIVGSSFRKAASHMRETDKNEQKTKKVRCLFWAVHY